MIWLICTRWCFFSLFGMVTFCTICVRLLIANETEQSSGSYVYNRCREGEGKDRQVVGIIISDVNEDDDLRLRKMIRQNIFSGEDSATRIKTFSFSVYTQLNAKEIDPNNNYMEDPHNHTIIKFKKQIIQIMYVKRLCGWEIIRYKISPMKLWTPKSKSPQHKVYMRNLIMKSI